MVRRAIAMLICGLAIGLAAQEGPSQQTDSKVTVPKKNPPPPRSDQGDDSNTNSGYSSSKTLIIDLNPPPGEGTPLNRGDGDDVSEMKPWNPHKALKATEVGDFYRKKKNYRAAESRYREALEYKPNDAVASFRLAQVLDKTGRGDEAIGYYKAYLKVLSDGEFAEECRKAITRISGTAQTKK